MNFLFSLKKGFAYSKDVSLIEFLILSKELNVKLNELGNTVCVHSSMKIAYDPLKSVLRSEKHCKN